MEILKTIIIPLAAVIAWVVLVKFLVSKLRERGKGHKFGNKIASHLGMRSHFFYSLLDDDGLFGTTEMVLRRMEQEGDTVQEASVKLAPYLEQGLAILERDFGLNEESEKAEQTIAKLMEDWRELQETQGSE